MEGIYRCFNFQIPFYAHCYNYWHTNFGKVTASSMAAMSPLPPMLIAVALPMSDVYRFELITELSI